MNKLSKILVTAGVLLLFFVVFGAISAANSASGKTPGFLGLIVFAALIGAMKAIWKKPKKEGEDNNNSSILQK